jgi:hypothetical protein
MCGMSHDRSGRINALAFAILDANGDTDRRQHKYLRALHPAPLATKLARSVPHLNQAETLHELRSR